MWQHLDECGVRAGAVRQFLAEHLRGQLHAVRAVRVCAYQKLTAVDRVKAQHGRCVALACRAAVALNTAHSALKLQGHLTIYCVI